MAAPQGRHDMTVWNIETSAKTKFIRSELTGEIYEVEIVEPTEDCGECKAIERHFGEGHVCDNCYLSQTEGVN